MTIFFEKKVPNEADGRVVIFFSKNSKFDEKSENKIAARISASFSTFTKGQI